MIHEVIVTTVNEDGSAHIAPMGISHADGLVQIAPFKPSTTLNNIQRSQTAVVNHTDNVLIFAGCLTGRKDWQTTATRKVDGLRLVDCLSHLELTMQSIDDDELRPRFYCKVIHEENHAPFRGYNRAQSAVLEAAILASRLHMLSAEKIDAELKYLQIGIDKTAGERERQAWQWLMEKISQHRQQQVSA